MKKILLPLSFIFFFAISCDKKSTNKAENEDVSELSPAENKVEQRSNTYAVLTSIATTDKQKYIDNIAQQTDQLNELWDKKIVSNIYMDSKPNEIAPTVIFFLRAKSVNEAKETLDKTNFIINGVGSYDVKPVGDLLFETNQKTLEMKSQKELTYAVVWDFSKKIDELPVDVMKTQLAAEEKLFENGIVENLYLNTANDGNKRTSSVYFINVNSQDEAEKILNELPIKKEKLGTYKLYDVGGFIRGVKK